MRKYFTLLFFVFLWTVGYGLWTNPSYAANTTPTLGTITPASGTSAANQALTFTTTYSDADGWQNIYTARLLINTSATGTNCFYAYYDQNSNKLYLRNDANTAWSGGYAPGAANTIENSYAKLDCSNTTITGSGTSLSISWNITFKSPFTGTKNTYLYVSDDSSAYVNWTKKGTWIISNNTPATGTITPASGSLTHNQETFFTTTYTDADTWQNINLAYILFNNSVTSVESVYGYYSYPSNKLYFYDYSQNKWLGGYAPGSDNVMETSWGKLNCKTTTVSGTSNTLTIKWALTFKPLFTGTRNSYLQVTDIAGGKNGWNKAGTITLPNNTPQLGTVTPSLGVSAINQALTFAATYSDADGWQNIYTARLVINTSATGTNCFYAYYDQNANKLYLRNDANTAWSGGYASGAAKIVENSYAKLDCSKTTVTGFGTNLSISWNITFKSNFTGTKNTYLYVSDDSSAYVNWTKKGNWIIDVTAPTGSVVINNRAGITNKTDILLTLSATDTESGMGTGAQMQFSNDNTTWSTAEDYAVSKSWTILTGDGTKTVYVKFKDVAGNWSQSYSSSTTLDTTPPVITITSPKTGDIFYHSEGTLEGTIDDTLNGEQSRTTFSEPFILTQEGENTLSKTASDLAGNSSTASILVYYYPGTEIGVGGGEITSSDGKVKLVIPEGALSQATTISISTINKETYENSAPTDTNLLSVVECRPYGLAFNKNVQIVYSLDNAEIPGTPVELGLYDSQQKKIISTGQTSTVPADGYTLTFSLSHFSTYAALKNLVSQGAPIGAGVKIPLPDMLTGSFSTAIPITVAPGRKGIQPQVSLNYRSSNANSWVGLGISLNPGYIVRSTRLGPATYVDTQDTFYLITDSGTTELVHLIDNLYQAKVESAFTKFYKETDDSWRVVSKDGGVMKFGANSDAKETAPLGTFSWYITKAVDTNGNYVEYSYTKDNGKVYPAYIYYTGNETMGVSPTNSVEFILEPRDDVSSTYTSGAKIQTAKRLKEIQVKVNSELVWCYELGYTYSTDTNRSMLTSVKQSGSDGKEMPEQKMSYQKNK